MTVEVTLTLEQIPDGRWQVTPRVNDRRDAPHTFNDFGRAMDFACGYAFGASQGSREYTANPAAPWNLGNVTLLRLPTT